MVIMIDWAGSTIQNTRSAYNCILAYYIVATANSTVSQKIALLILILQMNFLIKHDFKRSWKPGSPVITIQIESKLASFPLRYLLNFWSRP